MNRLCAYLALPAAMLTSYLVGLYLGASGGFFGWWP